MKKRLVKTITVLCLLCGFFVPVRVFAETASYYLYDDLLSDFHLVSGSFNWYFKADTECRIVCLSAEGFDKYNVVFAVFETQGQAGLSLSANPSISTVTDYSTYNGKRYYYKQLNYGQSNVDVNVPIVYVPFGDQNRTNIAIQYTYGDSAVDPQPPAPTYTRPANVAYNTRIAGSGTAAANNIDRIMWNSEVDTNGTVLPANARVQIRAIPGQYTGATKQDLLTKTYTDFVIDNTKAVQLVDILASRGVYETKWSEVTSHFNLPFATFNSLIQGNSYWYRNGWIYQIRLQVDDYYSDWTNIYTATGSGVKEAETISNSNTITQELVQQIQIINNLNETTTNWYVSNTEINMQPYEEPAEGDKPWWAYLLEAIVKAFGDILGFLGNLIGDLMDAITDLFKPAEFTINEYNDFKVEIKQNSGLFGQAIDFTNDLKNTFMGVQYQEPILHWQGISFDGVVFLPAADYNLNEYVEMWGLGDFRQIAYICSDGFIFFSLLLLIIRKLNEVLKK